MEEGASRQPRAAPVGGGMTAAKVEMGQTQRGASWSSWVRRVLIHAADFLDFEGKESAGGRQRHIRDLALTAQEDWGRDVLVVQKASHPFEVVTREGILVAGVRCSTSSLGDPMLGHFTARMRRSGDGVLYASGEDAFPFFVRGSKAVQHGVWWDGPLGAVKRSIQWIRVRHLVQSVRSIMCVDTAFPNALRTRFKDGVALAKKCRYIPNYADLRELPLQGLSRPQHSPLAILFARRWEHKRGGELFLAALEILARRGLDFQAIIFTAGESQAARETAGAMGLGSRVSVRQESLDGVLAQYTLADLAVVPTLWSEGTSLACVEAICAGVPVIATDVGGLGNLVIPGFNGVITPALPESVADAIQRAADPVTWATFRANCIAMRESLSLARWKEQVAGWLAE